MLLVYGPHPEPEFAANSTSVLSIDSCVFSDGVDVSKFNAAMGRLSGGLAILMGMTKYNVDISVWNVVSTKNIVTNFNIVIVDHMGTIKFNITNITSSMGNYRQPRDEAPFQFFCGRSKPDMLIPTTIIIIIINEHTSTGAEETYTE